MANLRPVPVGVYELLADYETKGLSVRVFRLKRDTEFVDLHRHRRSTQVYVALEGRVTIVRDGVETLLAPYEAVEVVPGVVHGARAFDAAATVMNISNPPLAVDDQAALGKEPHPAAFDLPGELGDVDD